MSSHSCTYSLRICRTFSIIILMKLLKWVICCEARNNSWLLWQSYFCEWLRTWYFLHSRYRSLSETAVFSAGRSGMDALHIYLIDFWGFWTRLCVVRINLLIAVNSILQIILIHFMTIFHISFTLLSWRKRTLNGKQLLSSLCLNLRLLRCLFLWFLQLLCRV